MTEEQKFADWFEKEKKKGLVDFKITLNPNGTGNREELFRELNFVVNYLASGKEIERGDVF